MQGTFYVVGVGPGDPQLLTLKAARVLEHCPVWLVPSAFEKGGSMALKIASGAVSEQGKLILSHRFPMKQVHRGSAPDPEVAEAWQEAARIIREHLAKGDDVAFPTLGDPAIYSTAFYVCETLQGDGPPIKMEIIPGVSAIGATSAVATLPLCLGDERLIVVPATFENGQLKHLLDVADCVVFMKVHKVMPKLVALLEELGLVDNAILVERCSLGDQKVWSDIRQVRDRELHYFSTMIVRKGPANG